MARAATILKGAGLLGVIGLAAGGTLYLSSEIEELSSRVGQAEQALRQEEAARRGLEREVRRALELYQLVGSELADKNEEFSSVLARAMVSKDTEIAENRRLINGLMESLESVRISLGTRLEVGRIETQDLSQKLAELSTSVQLTDQRLQGIDRSILLMRREAEDSAQDEPDPEIPDKDWILAQKDEVRRQVEGLEAALEADLTWIRGEIERLRRETDDLGHSVSRLETRRPQE